MAACWVGCSCCCGTRLGVVFGFHLGESPVRAIAVGLADAARVVIGVEEVHIDAGTVGLESGEEFSCPRGLRRTNGGVLLGEPDGVDDNVVLDVAAGIGGGVPGGSGDCATHVEGTWPHTTSVRWRRRHAQR